MPVLVFIKNRKVHRKRLLFNKALPLPCMTVKSTVLISWPMQMPADVMLWHRSC